MTKEDLRFIVKTWGRVCWFMKFDCDRSMQRPKNFARKTRGLDNAIERLQEILWREGFREDKKALIRQKKCKGAVVSFDWESYRTNAE